MMRLLRRLPDGRFELVPFDDDNLPLYAILSHTWQGEEVTHNDLVAGTGKSKAGHDKIRFCGDQAEKDGLEFFWIDSCCLDQSNMREVITAINSMFRWYQRASVCYVYLSDVSVPDGIDAEANPIAWLEAFRQSRWFTRCWTLQELLAPSVVQFFCRGGKRLGSKASLEQEICQITKISTSALQGKHLASFSFEERMGWTAGRETTVEEDRVYCLLGIFNVFLPLIYGEGARPAMARLWEEIQRRHKDGGAHSLRGLTDEAPAMATPLPAVVPPLAHNYVTVREGYELQITNRNELPYRVVKSLGMGGCAVVEMVQDLTTGQTYAHKRFRRYRGPNVNGFKQEVYNEIKVMRRLSPHRHIINLFATYACNRDVGLILTPVADEGDLSTYLLQISDSGRPPTLEDRTLLERAIGCLANGLAFIHKHTIRHKDIKPQNILLHQGRVIYTDFGIAFDGNESDSTTTTGTPFAFTRRYCAPEVANSMKRNRKSDVFSLGCVYIEILSVLEPTLQSDLLEARAFHEILGELHIHLERKQVPATRWCDVIRVCAYMLEADVDSRIDSSDLLMQLHAVDQREHMLPARLFCKSCYADI